MRTCFLFLVLLLSSCAAINGLIPGEPVTVERCQKLDMKKIGYNDGEIGQRPGDRFEYWMKDCRGIGVNLDRAAYDQGYAEGLKIYCSCEKGFASGVRDEYTEMRGQYYSCRKNEYQVFLKGHELGKKYSQDPSMTKKDGPYKMTYMDEVIEPKAKEECAALAKNNLVPIESLKDPKTPAPQATPSPGGAGPAAPTVPAKPDAAKTNPSSTPSASSQEAPPKN